MWRREPSATCFAPAWGWLRCLIACAACGGQPLLLAETPADALPLQVLEKAGQEPAKDLGLAGPKKLVFDLPNAGRALRLTGRLGVPEAAWVVELAGPNNARARLVLLSKDPLEASMSLDFLLPDRTRAPGPGSGQYFVRPGRTLYPGQEQAGVFYNRLIERTVFDEYQQLEAKYHLFKSVYEHAFTVHVEQTEEGVSAWLDGRFLATVPSATSLATGTLTLAQGNELTHAVEIPALRQGRFLPLDIRPYARPGSLQLKSLPPDIKPTALSTVAGVPLFVVEPKHNIDVGLSRWVEEGVDPHTYCDTDTTRTAFDGMPESIVLRVPKANYVAAHVLCLVEPNPNKVPALALRVTRFGNHAGDSGGRCDSAFADTTVYLPAPGKEEALPEGVRKLGEVEASMLQRNYSWFQVVESQKPARLPLYLAIVPLKMGEVADLLGEDAPAFGRRKDYWEIELTKEIRTAVSQFNMHNCRRKPLGLPSAVHVLAMTLERSPVDVQVAAKEKGNVFYAADNPAFQLRLVNHEDKAATLNVSCEIIDFYGKTATPALTVEVPAKDKDGGVAEATLPLSMPTLGHFRALISVKDAAGREIWRESTTFALLPPDTRKAGVESPFGAWWFVGSHGGCDRLDWMGPILLKMGMRHICPSGFKEEELAPYKLSYSMVPTASRGGGVKAAEEFIKRSPNVRIAMIFHEDGLPDVQSPFPELLGKPKPELTERAQKALEAKWKVAEEAAKWYRANHPNVKLSFGNSGPPLMVAFMRAGWPKQWVDCFGMEGVAGWFMTESQPRRGAMQEVWWLSEMRKLYGYESVPVSSGYEYIARCTQPGALTEREQADFCVRDAIHCLAYGFPSINIGLTDDSADSYSQTIYATSGFLNRNPLLTPKVSYVTYATMTRMLDSAKYARYLDTGSNSLYVLEFARGDERIYPVWTLRGTRSVALELRGTDPTVTDGMGATRALTPQNGLVELTATTTPMYLVLKGQVEKVTPGKPSYDEQPPAEPVVVCGLDDPSAWETQKEPDRYLETYAEDLLYSQGNFDIRPVDDPEKGKVLELELLPQPEVPKLYARYISLRLKQPAKLTGEVDRIGLWVKGNSCWGRVFWEFVDATGERYFSASDETSGWDVSDWKGRSAINFDGWCFVSLAIPKRYPGGFHSPHDRDWSFQGTYADGVVQHPITVTRVVIAVRDWQVYVTDLLPARSLTIRLKDLQVGSKD
jgi:hypothetical protein